MQLIPLILDLIIGIFLVIWIYRDAKSRDFNAFLWAMVAFLTSVFFLRLFGPILVLVVYFWMRPKGAMRRCPHCNKVYLDSATCPHCKQPTKKDCHRCLEAVNIEEEYCPKCHTKL